MLYLSAKVGTNCSVKSIVSVEAHLVGYTVELWGLRVVLGPNILKKELYCLCKGSKFITGRLIDHCKLRFLDENSGLTACVQ